MSRRTSRSVRNARALRSLRVRIYDRAQSLLSMAYQNAPSGSVLEERIRTARDLLDLVKPKP